LDDRSDKFNIIRKITIGDLVKIKYHNFDYKGNSTEELYGIVTDESNCEQIKLFPEVKVYLFKLKVIRKFTIGSLEIISHNKTLL
jgi:hypothetical protein